MGKSDPWSMAINRPIFRDREGDCGPPPLDCQQGAPAEAPLPAGKAPRGGWGWARSRSPDKPRFSQGAIHGGGLVLNQPRLSQGKTPAKSAALIRINRLPTPHPLRVHDRGKGSKTGFLSEDAWHGSIEAVKGDRHVTRVEQPRKAGRKLDPRLGSNRVPPPILVGPTAGDAKRAP